MGTRVAFLMPTLGSGGTGKVWLHLADELLRQGLTVDFVIGKKSGPYFNKLNREVQVTELGTTHPLFSLPPLIQYLRRMRPRALISDRIRLAVAALRARKLARVPVRVCTSVHIPLSHKLERLSQRKRQAETAKILKYLPLNDLIIAVSEGVAVDMIESLHLPDDKIRVIHNPVVTPDMMGQAQQPLSHPFFSEPHRPVILAAGRLTAQKDFPTLLRAFSILLQREPCRLIILGEGEERLSLENLTQRLGISAQVSMPGFVDNPYAFMARADLFVLSSAWEGSPNVLVEAMALGTSVVATDCPFGPREILQGGQIAPLVPVGDAQALAEAMTQVLREPQPAAVLKSAAARFSSVGCARAYREALGLE